MFFICCQELFAKQLEIMSQRRFLKEKMENYQAIFSTFSNGFMSLKWKKV